MMRALLIQLIAVLLLVGGGVSRTRADGGKLQLVRRQGDVRLAVFTSPNPLRAGPIDVSVLVQNANTGEIIRDGEVVVDLVPADDAHAPLRALATPEAATNKLFRAALVELPAPGEWRVRIECREAGGSTPIEAHFTIEAAPPLPQWLSVWPWFSWPIVAVGLFAVHRILVARRNASRPPRPTVVSYAPFAGSRISA